MFDIKLTDAFKHFVDKKFISHFKEYLPYNYDLEDNDAEIVLWGKMCRYYNDKIQEKFDFNHIKDNYNKACRNLSPNLSVQQKDRLLKREQDKLETFARLKYCNEDIDNYSYELIPLMYLFSIYSKLNKKSLNDIAGSAVGQYLLYVGLECGISFPHLLDLPLITQATNLHNSLAVFDYNIQNMEFLIDRGNEYPILCVNRYLKDDFDVELTDEELEEFESMPNAEDQVIFINNKKFHERLINEMHTLKNGMIF